MKCTYLSFLALAGAQAFTGCTVSQGPKVDAAAVQKIEKGVTTRSELVSRFGEPTSSEISSESKETLTWLGVSSSTDAKMMIPLVGAMMGNNRSNLTTLTVILGKDGKVESFTFSQENHGGKVRVSNE